MPTPARPTMPPKWTVTSSTCSSDGLMFELSRVGADDVGVDPDGLRRAAGEQPRRGHHVDEVADIEDEVGIVLDQHHRQPLLLGEAAEQGGEGPLNSARSRQCERPTTALCSC